MSFTDQDSATKTMAMKVNPNLKDEPVKDLDAIIDTFRLGYVSLLEEARLPIGAAYRSDNLYQTQDGLWSTKMGSAYYNDELPIQRIGAAVIKTNQIGNPSFESATTGVTALSGAGFATSTAQHFSGAQSLQVTPLSGGGGVKIAVASSIPAGVYTGSVYVYSATSQDITMSIFSGAIAKGTVTVTVPAATWTRLSVTTSAGVIPGDMRVSNSTTAVFYVDAAQMELSSAATEYFDGSLTDTNTTDYDWTGPVNNSPSTASVYLYDTPQLDGAQEFVRSDGSTEMIEVANGKVYRSTNGGTRTQIAGTVTLTGGYECFFLQILGYLYIANGQDPLIRYDGSTLAQYTGLSTPTAPSLSKSGLVGTTNTYYYVVVATNSVGWSTPSTETSIQVGKQRDSWISGTDSVGVTITRVTGATRYTIFLGDESGYELYLDSVADPGSGTTFVYTDDGTKDVNVYVETPNDNTSTGPKFTQMELSGNRIWATADPNNPWRVYFSGTGQSNIGTFSQFYGGGYVDLEPGGRERPTSVEHFRDGKGNAFATVFTNDPQGVGSTWQIELQTSTIGTTSFIVPAATKTVGSIGAAGPHAVAKVRDDLIMGNQRGAFSLGSKPQLLNVLSTTELSANIRPDWRNINGSAAKKIANYYYDAKVFWAVPYASNDNSEIWVQDTEKRNWQLRWTGLAVRKFLEYTDTNGHSHFLAIPVGGKRLVEISSSYRGDLGQPFQQDFRTGIMFPSNDHTEWAQVENLYADLGNLQGTITLELLGTDRKGIFRSLKTMQISGPTASSAGWSSHSWSAYQWSDLSDAPVVQTLVSVKKALRVNKLLNNYQIRIHATSLDTSFTTLRFQIKGYIVPINDPSIWRKTTTPTSVSSDTLTTETGEPLLI